MYDLVEKDLVLLGATAIEDKLQDGVNTSYPDLLAPDLPAPAPRSLAPAPAPAGE